MTKKKIATVADILAALETFAPLALAEEWDNPGLQVGDLKREVGKIWTALDPTPEVVVKAIAARCDLLLTHHPLFFHPIKSINLAHACMRAASLAIKADLSVVAAHTNLDAAQHGVNYLLAEKIGLKNIQPLMACKSALIPGCDLVGLGRVGKLPRPATLGELARKINHIFNGDGVRVAGNLELSVSTVAVCGGSGGSLINAFLQSGANAFISGDFGYHQALEAESNGYGLIDLGHFRSENIVVEPLAKLLQKALAGMGFDLKIEAYDAQKEPFKYIGADNV